MNLNKYLFLIGLTGLSVLTACNNEPKQETQDAPPKIKSTTKIVDSTNLKAKLKSDRENDAILDLFRENSFKNREFSRIHAAKKSSSS